MRGYVKRVSQKAAKLSQEQLVSLLDDMVEENENLYSILESISAGLLIVDNDFFLLQSNKIVESRLNFSVFLDDPKATSCPIWEIMEDEEIGEYFKKCAEKEITNTTEDFTIMTSGGSVRFITITMTPLVHAGETTGKIILVRDVTEKKNQEVLLQQTLQQPINYTYYQLMKYGKMWTHQLMELMTMIQPIIIQDNWIIM